MHHIYVAGSSDLRERARVIDAMVWVMQHPGLTLTFDWVGVLERETKRAGGPARVPLSVLTQSAVKCEEAVREADIVWGLAPRTPGTKSEGLWYELGLAQGLGKRVYLSGGTHTFDEDADGGQLQRCLFATRLIATDFDSGAMLAIEHWLASVGGLTSPLLTGNGGSS